MQDTGRIPRWIIENDPSWEKSVDSTPQLQKWIKKGTNIQAVSTPTSISCEIIGETSDDAGVLTNPLSSFIRQDKRETLIGTDLTKYLSSIYLNPGISDSARFDITRSMFLKSRESKF
jgi:hypothetical protein